MNDISPDFEYYGGSYLISEKNYELHINGADKIGRPDGQFMVPSNQMDDLLSKHPNDPREWERQLGLYNESLGNSNVHRVNVYSPHDYAPRLPTQDLSGANDKFIPGGKTPGGQDECVINQFPNPENNPSVGKITTLDIGLNNAQNTDYNSTSSANVAAVGGGGARAPNEQIAGTKPTEASTAQTNPAEIAGQKPVQPQTAPENTERQIAGTLPGKEQDFDRTAGVNNTAATGKDLAEEAGKKASSGIDAGAGIQ